MGGQPVPVETTVSADPEPGPSDGVLPADIRKNDIQSLRTRVGLPALCLMAVGLVLLAGISGRRVSRVDPSASSSALLHPAHVTEPPDSSMMLAGLPDDKTDVAAATLGEGGLAGFSAVLERGPSLGPGPERDDWGLSSLEHFEQTLPLKLKEGKEALATWASEFSWGEFKSEAADSYQRDVAQALSNGSSDSLVGMTIVIHNTKLFGGGRTDKHLPQTLRVSEVVEYYRWNLVVNAEDVMTKEEYSVNIPIIPMGMVKNKNAYWKKIRQAAEDEKQTILQACGKVPPELAASQKGIAVPTYTGKISGLTQFHSVRRCTLYNTATLMERIVGDLGHLRCKGGELKKKARDYIASRLLQIVLKLEHSGIGHLRLSWDSLFLREDGSFFLGNFGNGAPFDEVLSPLRGTLSPNAEPHTIYLSEKNKIVVPEAKGNMWSLGVLLYQLYTGNEHPYGKMEGSDWMQGEASLSEYLLRANIRSQVLIPQLEASKVPKRWAQLIVRLLEPRRMHRIGGFQILQEFPDLINNTPE